MRKAAIALGILLTPLLAGLLVAPQLVDLDRFKGPLAAALSQRTGRSVDLAGPIGLSLLPSPTVTARSVRLGNPPGAAVPDMVRLRALEVKLSLWPLLTGRVDVSSARLVEPEIDLERLPGGQGNWRFHPPGRNAAGSTGSPPAVSAATPLEAPGFGQLVIQNAAINYRQGDAVERLEHINASISIEPGSGQISASGDLVARGAAFSFEWRSGALDADELPLQLTVTSKPSARLQIDARLTGAVDDRRISGKLKLAAEDAQSVVGTLARLGLPAPLAQPVALSADVDGSMQRLALDHLTFALGPARGQGKLRLEAGTPLDLDLTFTVNRLDLDRWPAGRKLTFERGPAPPVAALAAERDVSPAPPLRNGQPQTLLRAINAKVDCGVDALVWRGGLIRDVRLKLNLSDGRASLLRLAALLPGGSEMSLSGHAALGPEGLIADGVVEANADDLRSLFAWFGVALDAVPADRLRKAALSSRFTLAGDRLDLGAIDASLDATRLSAAATLLLRARPGLGLRLIADRFSLDAYLPQPAAGAANVANAPASGSAGQALGVDALAGFDANIDASVQSLTWHGQPLNGVHLVAALQNGDATVQELSVADISGAALSLSGVVEGLAATATGQLAYDMHGQELERVLRTLSPALAAGRRFGGFTLGVALQFDAETVTVDSELKLLDGQTHVIGDIARASGKLDLDIDLQYPSFARLVRTFAPGYQAAGGDPGPVRLSARINGKRPNFALNQIVAALGTSTLAGSLAVDLTRARPQISADLTLEDWQLDRLFPARRSALLKRNLAPRAMSNAVLLVDARSSAGAANGGWSAEPLDLGALALANVDLRLSGHNVAWGGLRLDELSLTGMVKDGALSVEPLAGKLLGGTLEASVAVNVGGVPSVRGRLALKDADLMAALTETAGLAMIGGRFDVAAELASAGRSEAEIARQLSGKGSIEARNGMISGIDLKAMSERLNAPGQPIDLLALLRGGAGGQTPFSALDGSFRIADGVAESEDLHLAADGGDAKATARVDLAGWRQSSRVEFRLAGAGADVPPLGLRIDGPIDAPRAVFDVNALERFLAQRMPPRP